MRASLADRIVARLATHAPRPIVRTIAARYIAGETVTDAIREARRLKGEGILATLDILGESVHRPEDAEAFERLYLEAVAALGEAGLERHVSLKPTALGSLFDRERCAAHIATIVDAVGPDGTVTIDMEWSATTDPTLALFRELRAAGHANVATVVQARLRRTLGDVAALADLRPNLRVCKGIYPEPATIAHVDPDAIRTSYLQSLETLVAAGGYAALATHDAGLIQRALTVLERHAVPRSGYEFQLLLGVKPELARQLAADGHRVRIYLPFGEGSHAYALRRLNESPHVAGYVAREVARTILRRTWRG